MANRGKRIPVLITGAGSELAFSILKACRLSTLPLQLVACDMDPNALGLYWSQRSYLVPGVQEEPDGYLKALSKIVRQESVRAIFPTPDAELEFLPEYRDIFRKDFGCWIMTNSAAEMARFSDKWLAYQWYLEHELPAPRTARPDVASELEHFLSEVPFPVVLKSRIGGGSRFFFRIRNRSELGEYLPVVPRPLVQEYLAPEHEEYTAGTFRTKADDIHVILLRRKLKFGMTNVAEVIHNDFLEDFCRNVIWNTNLQGVNNIQFRYTADGPKILEINPRFSGTTGIRAHYGFNEPEMVVRQFVLGEEVPPPRVGKGKVLRCMAEEYVQPEKVRSFVDLRM